MSTKNDSSGVDEHGEVFRQFAWHLAGSLAAGQSGRGAAATAKPRPGKAGVKRPRHSTRTAQNRNSIRQVHAGLRLQRLAQRRGFIELGAA